MSIIGLKTVRIEQKTRLLKPAHCSVCATIGHHFNRSSVPKSSYKCIHCISDRHEKIFNCPVRKKLVAKKGNLEIKYNYLLIYTDLVVAFTIKMLCSVIKKTGEIMWIAVPNTNKNRGNFYRDLNELLAKNYMLNLNIVGHMPPELNPTLLTVVPSVHTPKNNLDSPTVTHKSISLINSRSTDLDTAETCPSEDCDDFWLRANEAFL